MRPNIRVEIQNNLVEPMEVEENEEGEILDGDDKGPLEKHNSETENTNKTPSAAFMTGVNIIDKKEQEKLQERARRFHLNPGEIKNFTDEDLQLLHSSLGINATNELNVRFEVIHLRGIEQMNAGDILDYFLEYAPVSVEWIDEESCNVVWSDKLSAARALHFMSKPVRGMPVRDDSSYFDTLNEGEEVDQSILVINRNREIQIQEDVDTDPNKLLNENNSVDISEITSTIPPGYWRLGNKHLCGKSLLLRFSLKTDKKCFKTEPFSRYYKTQGKKNVQGAKHTSQGIFGRNKDMHKVRSNGNPWSALAKNWDEDAEFRERERISYTADEPKMEIKNHSLRVRLGSKRKEEDETEHEESEKPKKIKIPRMRMYADEEEEKIKRRKMLKKIDHQIKKIEDTSSANSDLRTILNMTNRSHGVKVEQTEPETFDLGTTLKNRNRKMVFEIKTEADEPEERIPEKKHHAESSREKTTKRGSKKYSDDEDAGFRNSYKHDKPRSKVAVVIKTQKKPSVASAVASTVWSRVSRFHETDSEDESSSEYSNSQKSSDSESEEAEELVSSKSSSRPGFNTKLKERSLGHSNFKSPLKIEINNDHFKRT